MMKKVFGYYSAGWFISLVLFHIMAFVIGGQLRQEFDAGFWIGYIFILVAFLGLLLVAYKVLNGEGSRKLFYRIPLMRISKIGLVITLIVGSVFVTVPGLPAWVGAILCLLIMVLNVIALLKASAAAEVVGEIDNKIQTQTAFMRALTVESQNLLARSATPELRKVAELVYETVRYSDPMSHDALSGIEAQISLRFSAFETAVTKQDGETATAIAAELLALLNARSGKCKMLKTQI